jgi:hypothetical protein
MKEENISPADRIETEAPPSPLPSAQPGIKEGVKQTTQAVKSEIEKLKGAAREQGSAAVEEIKSTAQSAAREAQEAGLDFLHQQKEVISQRVHQYSGALRAASDRLSSEEGNVLAQPAQKWAEQLERMSTYLRDKEPSEFLDDLETFARRKPEVLFGGLFVLGFAAARFLKASRKRPRRAGPAELSGDSGALQLSAPSSSFIPATSSQPVSASPEFSPAFTSSPQGVATSSVP